MQLVARRAGLAPVLVPGLGLIVALGLAAGGCAAEDVPAGVGAGSEARAAALAPESAVLQLHFLYVHGVKGCRDDRTGAEGSLDELDAAIAAELPAWIDEFEASHPGVTVVTSSAHANVYTATPSGFHPSDSTDPLNLDDWEVGDPGCSATAQGQPCTTAYEWRHRLAQEIQQHFPGSARNIVLIGHSTGARAAFEVAANAGPGGVNTHDWGVQDRIAGVVSIQGMVDALGTSKYNVIGGASFETTCKLGDPIMGFGGSCAQGNGWCEYAGRISGFGAADWVAQNRQALMLTSFASCSPSLFTGFTDGPLPFDAQGSPKAVGLQATAAPGKTFRPAHGEKYGSFCHSAVVAPGHAGHAAAVSSARDRILEWLFVDAQRVASSGTIETASIGRDQSTPTFALGGSCPAGQTDGDVRVVGRCKHPGFFDGDDHVVAASELALTDGPTCNGTVRWTQRHDSNKHAATLWWKTYATPTGAGVIHGLPLD
jgi:hypothetical protein